MAGLYIHIPFCESRCIYCGFYSTTSLKLRDAYVDALCGEMQLRPVQAELVNEDRIETIYLGGGTPSQLSGEQLIRLFHSIEGYVSSEERSVKSEKQSVKSEKRSVKSEEFCSDENKKICDGKIFDEKVFDGMEVTMECNPDDITEEYCQTLQQLPINRISMGAQTFSDERLRFLHRRHTAQEVEQAVARLRNIGIKNISIDLMFGFPGETIAQWENDIDEAIHLDVDHISAYSLMYEEGTALHRLLEAGKISEIDEETSRRMYDTLIQKLTLAGYEHYEISNFARPGRRSRHNSSYWHETPYIGLGAAAHSYRRMPQHYERNWNCADLPTYIESIGRGKRPYEYESLDLQTRYNDLITTALRTSDGIDIELVGQEFGEEYKQQLLADAQTHILRGVVKVKGKHLSLTHKGLYISDDVMSDFIIV